MTPIPRTLEEAVEQILGQMTEADKEAFAAEPEGSPGARYHHGVGTAIRNEWQLWDRENPTPLVKWFRANGLWHADDFSAIIFKAVWSALNRQRFDIAKERAYYEDFWRRSGLGFDGEQIPGHVEPKTRWFKLTEGGLMEEVDGRPGDPTQEEGL